MAENNSPGFFAAVWRFITFYKLRKALGIARAADRQFTGSADGIADAYDIEHDNLVHDYNQLLEAVSQVESAIEQKRLQQKAIDPKLEEAKRALKGAIEKYSQEEAKGDKADQELLKKHKDAGTRFKADVDRMTKQKAALDEEIKAQEPQITQLESRLTAMQTTIRNLPQQKAEKIAQFISNKAIIDANAKLNNLKSSADHSPLDAVDKALSDQSAKAKVSSRIAGTDSDAQRNEYVAAGETESASDDFDALVAAHKAEKAAKTGAVPVAPERDKI